jgi:hypothetical protein
MRGTRKGVSYAYATNNAPNPSVDADRNFDGPGSIGEGARKSHCVKAASVATASRRVTPHFGAEFHAYARPMSASGHTARSTARPKDRKLDEVGAK